MLYIACFLLFGIGAVHSVLGEKYILIRLFRRDNLPKLFGDTWFTKQTLRFAWHITTVAWWGLAAIVFLLNQPDKNTLNNILWVISIAFILSGLIALVCSKAKHFSWVVFLAIGLLCGFSAFK